jgi:hypothetical protein
VVEEVTFEQFLVFLEWLKHGHIITPTDRGIWKLVKQKYALGPTPTTNYRKTLFADPRFPSEPTTLEELYGIPAPEVMLSEEIFHENWAVLIDVYAFADQWGIRALLQAIIYKLEQLYESCESWFPFEEFEHLAAKLPAPSPLVRFSLYCFVRHLKLDFDKKTEDYLERLPKKFLVQWLIVFSKVCRPRAGNLPGHY